MTKKTEAEIVRELVARHSPEELARAYLRASRRARKAETKEPKLSGDDVMDYLRKQPNNFGL